MIVTFAFNVPLNDVLATVDPASPEGARQWASYLVTWTNWNHVRIAGALFRRGGILFGQVNKWFSAIRGPPGSENQGFAAVSKLGVILAPFLPAALSIRTPLLSEQPRLLSEHPDARLSYRLQPSGFGRPRPCLR